ncbi:MAG TPA: DUF4150 domain-containing protein [Polyangiaceae bacterium]|nr:DUF4150 domain-containing protein [Polyangiaceae bacterium]
MLPASNRGAGQALAFPDVCNTPVGPATAPIPYPNMGMTAQAQNYSQFVKISGVNALNIGSTITQTMGDEAGTAHPTIKGSVTFTQGDAIVSIDKLPAVRLTSMTSQNNMNAPVGAVIVPSSCNVTMCRRGEATDAPLRQRSVVDSRLFPGGVLCLTIQTVGPDVVAGVYGALRSRKSVRGLVMDLRDNPGGDLEAALALASTFLPRGTLVASIDEPDGHRRHHHSRDGALGMPVALVVDEGTASSTELVVAALAEHGRALVVGTRTYGKVAAQRWSADGMVDAGRWWGPRARDYARVGIEPDLSGREDPVKLAWAVLVRGWANAIA